MKLCKRTRRETFSEISRTETTGDIFWKESPMPHRHSWDAKRIKNLPPDRSNITDLCTGHATRSRVLIYDHSMPINPLSVLLLLLRRSCNHPRVKVLLRPRDWAKVKGSRMDRGHAYVTLSCYATFEVGNEACQSWSHCRFEIGGRVLCTLELNSKCDFIIVKRSWN